MVELAGGELVKYLCSEERIGLRVHGTIPVVGGGVKRLLPDLQSNGDF